MSDKQDIPEVISVQFDPSSNSFGTFDRYGMDGDAKYHSDAKYQALVDKHIRDMQAIVDEIINNTLIKRNLTQNEQAHLAFDINKAFEGK